MSKMGNYRVEMQESPDYEWGWKSAERGEPMPSWHSTDLDGGERLLAQRTGWRDYHYSEDGQ